MHTRALKISVTVAIQASGETKAVEAQGEAPEPVLACIRDAVAAWRYPAAEGESEYVFPMVWGSRPTMVR